LRRPIRWFEKAPRVKPGGVRHVRKLNIYIYNIPARKIFYIRKEFAVNKKNKLLSSSRNLSITLKKVKGGVFVTKRRNRLPVATASGVNLHSQFVSALMLQGQSFGL
jgi:hypothetical protein